MFSQFLGKRRAIQGGILYNPMGIFSTVNCTLKSLFSKGKIPLITGQIDLFYPFFRPSNKSSKKHA